jgi:hypothetical protein
MHYFSNLFDKVLYKFFGRVRCPSSGVSQHCIHTIICHALIAEPKDISAASVRDICLFIRGTGLLNLC